MKLEMQNDDVFLGRVKRTERADEALHWAGGTQSNRRKYVVWKNDDYEVSLNKPGKEASPEYLRCRYADGHSGNNPSDMLPMVKKNGEAEKDGTFAAVFKELLISTGNNVRAGEILGALLVRSAYMIDHDKDKNGNWRYNPPIDALKELSGLVPTMFNVSTEAFLHYLDALAWNEDVKYRTLGYDISKDYGRPNNLLTYANIVAASIDRADLGQVLGNFARPPSGVSPISRSKAFEVFPDLGTYARLQRRKSA